MKKRRSVKALAGLLAGISLSGRAITYYISPTGNDNASGTSIGAPWQSISKLNSVNLLPGTIVLFQGGQAFSGSIYLDSNDGNDPSNPILISSYGQSRAIIRSGMSMGLNAYNTRGIEVSNLVFEGSGMNSNSSNGVSLYTDLIGDIKLSHIKLTNLEIMQYGKTGLSVFSQNGNTGFKDVIIDGAHVHHVKENGIFIGGYTAQNHVGWAHENVVIRNTEADNVPGYSDPAVHKGSGIIMGQVNGGLIERSSAHHTGSGNTHCGGPGGIWAYDCNNLIIQHCESYLNSSGSGCDGLGFDLDGGITNSILQYNYSHNNDGAGYLLGQYDNARPWLNNIVRYNISENDGRTNAGGITLFKGANTSMSGCKIYNNTVYMTPSPINNNAAAFSISAWNTGISNIEVYNNIFQSAGGAWLVHVPQGYSAFFAGNLYWSTGAAFKIWYQGALYGTVAAWRSATNNEKVGNLNTGITADPLLFNAGNAITAFPAPTWSLNAYKTGGSSPAINAGLDLVTLFAVNTGNSDFFKNLLPAANQRDIGAFEKPDAIITGIDDLSGNNFTGIRFFPNPIMGGESLQLNGGEAPYSVELYNLAGQRVSAGANLQSEYLIMPGVLVSGIYIISVRDSRGRKSSGKIVIRNR